MSEEETMEVLKQIRYSLYVDEYHYEWQLAIDSMLGLYSELKKENEKLKQEIKIPVRQYGKTYKQSYNYAIEVLEDLLKENNNVDTDTL